MPDPRQLPFVLKLIDDPSPVVREGIARELASWGPGLGGALTALPEPPDEQDRARIRELVAPGNREWLRESWASWYELGRAPAGRPGGEPGRIEAAFSLLSEFHDGRMDPPALGGLLDGLASDYRRDCGAPDPRRLAAYLFQERGLRGETRGGYRPEHSDLAQVIRGGKGIPLSLALVYVLVGRRLKLPVESCNFPGHFLARFRENDAVLLVDAFERGRILREDELTRGARISGGTTSRKPDAATAGMVGRLVRARATAEAVVARGLRNLIQAYTQAEQPAEARLMMDLLKQLGQRERARRKAKREQRASVPAAGPTGGSSGSVADVQAPPNATFLPGQLVRHRRYDYRGVVVAVDDACRADHAWYWSNQSQPDRNQPWYHVLVHGSTQVTYAAQNNLEVDESKEAVDHPLVREYFAGFEGGRYRRNGQPWPNPWRGPNTSRTE